MAARASTPGRRSRSVRPATTSARSAARPRRPRGAAGARRCCATPAACAARRAQSRPARARCSRRRPQPRPRRSRARPGLPAPSPAARYQMPHRHSISNKCTASLDGRAQLRSTSHWASSRLAFRLSRCSSSPDWSDLSGSLATSFPLSSLGRAH